MKKKECSLLLTNKRHCAALIVILAGRIHTCRTTPRLCSLPSNPDPPRMSVAFSVFVRFGRVGTPLNFRQCESRTLHPAFMCNDIFILFPTHSHSQRDIGADMLQNGRNTFWPCANFLSTHFVAICNETLNKKAETTLS